MASISAIRDGIQVRLATIAGLRAFDLVKDQIPVPCAMVSFPERIEYDTTYGAGRVTLTIPVRVYASRASERAGQDRLDGYLASSGASSVKAAIESDRTLGGACESVQVPIMREYGTYTFNAVEYLGFEVEVEVVALG